MMKALRIEQRELELEEIRTKSKIKKQLTLINKNPTSPSQDQSKGPEQAKKQAIWSYMNHLKKYKMAKQNSNRINLNPSAANSEAASKAPGS